MAGSRVGLANGFGRREVISALRWVGLSLMFEVQLQLTKRDVGENCPTYGVLGLDFGFGLDYPSPRP
jgi:hypothetical protein